MTDLRFQPSSVEALSIDDLRPYARAHLDDVGGETGGITPLECGERCVRGEGIAILG